MAEKKSKRVEWDDLSGWIKFWIILGILGFLAAGSLM